MSSSDTTSDQIEQNALKPKKVQVGNQSVEQHSIPDQIAADEHNANKKAVKRRGFGLRTQVTRFRYP